jgi:RNA polymerase subunit RPABC4/transcription elongation factor Spt4
MKARKIGVVKFRSASAYARNLLVNSKMSDSEIARRSGITAQTVYAIKMQMLMKG